MKTILFNEKFGLRTSVLEGIKTMTRRVIKLKDYDKKYLEEAFDFDLRESIIIDIYSRYKVGEIVAIAQPYKDIVDNSYFLNQLAENNKSIGMMKEEGGWSNSMFAASYYMPHHIRITDIKVERLQDIGDEDCINEGIVPDFRPQSMSTKYYVPNQPTHCFTEPREAFAALIDKVSGKGTWDSNPYVFCYTFELVD